MGSIEENKAVIRRFVEEVQNKKNWDVFDELNADDFVNHSSPPGLPNDREGGKLYLAGFMGAFPDCRFAIDDMIAKARTLVDENAAVKAYKDIQIYIADKVYTVAGLPEPYAYIMVAPRVQNYQFSVNHGYGTETFSKLWLNS